MGPCVFLGVMELEQTVRCAQQGDRDAREALARYWLPVVYAAAIARTRRAAEADDLTQEAFVRAFRRLDTLRIPSRFGPWLLQIVRNAARDQARRRRPESGLATWDPPARESSAPGESPALDAWRALPEMQRLVCWLNVVLDVPVREIATLVGVSKSTVGRWLERGIARMRTETRHVDRS